jgi:hypothetical protein
MASPLELLDMEDNIENYGRWASQLGLNRHRRRGIVASGEDNK